MRTEMKSAANVSNLIDVQAVSPKCMGLFKKGFKARNGNIDLEALGDPHYNNFLKFVKCQSKSTKEVPCKLDEKAYDTCHTSIMGVGSYKGKKSCADEIKTLVACAMTGSKK